MNKHINESVADLQARLGESKPLIGGSEDGHDAVAANVMATKDMIVSVLGNEVGEGSESGVYAMKSIQLRGKQQKVPDSVVMVNPFGSHVKTDIAPGNEAFVDFDKTMSNAVAITLQSAIVNKGIDPVIDAYFPTYLVDPEKFGYTIEVEVAEFVNPKVNPLSGVPAGTQATSIIKELVTSDKFKVAANRLYPVVRDATADYIYNPDGKNLAYNVTVADGEVITTAPVKFGVTVPFLEVGQSNASAARELTDWTDTLTDTAIVNTIEFELAGKDADGNDIVELFKTKLPKNMARFAPSNANGAETNEFTLMYTVDGLTLKAGDIYTTSVDADGNPVPTVNVDLLAMVAGSYISLDVTLAGKLNLGNGQGVITVAQSVVNGVYSYSNVLLEDDVALAAKAVAETAAFKSYEAELYSSNENLRTRSIQLTSSTVSYGFGVTPKQLCSEVLPISEEKRLVAKSFSTELFIKNSMVSEGLSLLQGLISEINALTPGSASHGVFGGYFNPVGLTDDVDLSAVVKTRRTFESQDDIKQALEYAITEMAIELGSASNYKRAYKTFNTGNPTVIVGTTSSISRYLEDFTSAGYDFKIRTTDVTDAEFGDVITIGFGDVNVTPTTPPKLTQFGRCAYTPGYTVVRTTNANTNSASSETMSVYDYHVHAKVFGMLNVLNLSTFTRNV